MGHHAMKLQGPGLSSPAREADSVRARSEETARRALDGVLRAHHEAGEDSASNRATARRLHVSDVYLRDMRDGDRAIPLWLVLALPASSLRQLGLRCEQAARDLCAVGE